MKKGISAARLAFVGLTFVAAATAACDEEKSGSPAVPEAAASAAAEPAPPPPAPTPTPSAAPAPAFVKKLASDCKPHVVDFGGDDALEKEVRRKLGKDKGTITPADLANIKSINLSQATVHQIDPCIFPMFTSMKDLFLGSGDYDDLTPLKNLTNMESLRAALSQVKDLQPIAGLKRMDRLDLSHTQVTDADLKVLSSLTNVTELMLDEDSISDISPVSAMKKLERLSIKKTRVQNLAPVAGIHTLKYLYIAETPVSDISPVQPLMSGGLKLIQN
jgi:internalin A